MAARWIKVPASSIESVPSQAYGDYKYYIEMIVSATMASSLQTKLFYRPDDGILALWQEENGDKVSAYMDGIHFQGSVPHNGGRGPEWKVGLFVKNYAVVYPGDLQKIMKVRMWTR
jgi:hypothetical protein